MSKDKDRIEWLDAVMWLLMLVPFLILARELQALPKRIATERGIDAHTVEVTATYAEFQEAPRYGKGRNTLASDKHVLSYVYDGRPIRGVLSTEPLVEIGEELCVEIDAERPERVRECGYDELEVSVHRITLGTVLLIPLAGYVVFRWRQRRRQLSAAVDARLASGNAGWTIKARNAGQDLVLRPAARTRNTVTIVYPLFLAVFVFLVWAEGTTPQPWLFPVGAAVPLLAVRCWRMAVRCVDGTVTVRGFLLNRRIPANAVLAVTNETSESFPSIWWETPSGRRRRTRLNGFWVADRAGERELKHHKDQLARLRGWLKANVTVPAGR